MEAQREQDLRQVQVREGQKRPRAEPGELGAHLFEVRHGGRVFAAQETQAREPVGHLRGQDGLVRRGQRLLGRHIDRLRLAAAAQAGEDIGAIEVHARLIRQRARGADPSRGLFVARQRGLERVQMVVQVAHVGLELSELQLFAAPREHPARVRGGGERFGMAAEDAVGVDEAEGRQRMLVAQPGTLKRPARPQVG